MNNRWAAFSLILLTLGFLQEGHSATRRTVLGWLGAAAVSPQLPDPADAASAEVPLAPIAPVPAAPVSVDPSLQMARTWAFDQRLQRITTVLNNYGQRDRTPFAALDALIYLKHTRPEEVAFILTEIDALAAQTADEIVAGRWDQYRYEGSMVFGEIDIEIGAELMKRVRGDFGHNGLSNGEWDRYHKWAPTQAADLDVVLANRRHLPLNPVMQAIHMFLYPDRLLEMLSREDFKNSPPELFTEEFFNAYIRELALVSPRKALFIRRFFKDTVNSVWLSSIWDRIEFHSVRGWFGNREQTGYFSADLVPKFGFVRDEVFRVQILDPEAHARETLRALGEVQILKENLTQLPMKWVRDRLGPQLSEVENALVVQLRETRARVRALADLIPNLASRIALRPGETPPSWLLEAPIEADAPETTAHQAAATRTEALPADSIAAEADAAWIQTLLNMARAMIPASQMLERVTLELMPPDLVPNVSSGEPPPIECEAKLETQGANDQDRALSASESNASQGAPDPIREN